MGTIIEYFKMVGGQAPQEISDEFPFKNVSGKIDKHLSTNTNLEFFKFLESKFPDKKEQIQKVCKFYTGEIDSGDIVIDQAEYITVFDEQNYSWEKFGGADIDLSNYAKLDNHDNVTEFIASQFIVSADESTIESACFNFWRFCFHK